MASNALSAEDRKRLFGSDSDSDSDSDASVGTAAATGTPVASGVDAAAVHVNVGSNDGDGAHTPPVTLPLAVVQHTLAVATPQTCATPGCVLQRRVGVLCEGTRDRSILDTVSAAIHRGAGRPLVEDVDSSATRLLSLAAVADQLRRGRSASEQPRGDGGGSNSACAGAAAGSSGDVAASAGSATRHALTDAEPGAWMYDVVVDMHPSWSTARLRGYRELVIPGGAVVMVVPSGAPGAATARSLVQVPSIAKHFSAAVWDVEHSTMLATEGGVVCTLRSRGVLCNTEAVSWASSSPAAITAERARIAAVTVVRSAAERGLGELSTSSVERAINCLRKHGMVIFTGLAPPPTVAMWGSKAQQDFDEVESILRGRGIDITRPHEGPRIDNFYELGMRQALRCDLRHSPRMREVKPVCASTAHGHRALKRVVRPVCDPPGAHSGGNWGRWNFEGGGPHAPKPDLTVCPAGAVMSLPGAADQLLHADTPHLYDHLHLPPHYLNFFFPAAVLPQRSQTSPPSAETAPRDTAFAVGQTAFLLGSHYLEHSEACMDHPAGETAGLAEQRRRLVRPHLALGDALLFDVRLLHMGLANRSATVRRPVLYVNWHQAWWNREKVDKNFTPERLFEANEAASTTSPPGGGAGGGARAGAGAGSGQARSEGAPTKTFVPFY